MDLNLTHIIVTALVVFVMVMGVERTSLYQTASRPKRGLILGVIVFVVLSLLNLVWPAGVIGT